jgi:hypothetical protein
MVGWNNIEPMISKNKHVPKADEMLESDEVALPVSGLRVTCSCILLGNEEFLVVFFGYAKLLIYMRDAFIIKNLT